MGTLGNNWEKNRYPDDYLARPSRRPVVSHLVLQERLLSIKKGHDDESLTLLDLGCGSGALFEGAISRFERKFDKLVGVDANPQMLSTARKKFPTFHFLDGDVEQVDELFSGEKFDAVVLSHMIEMLASPGAVLSAVSKILRGTLYIEFFEPPSERFDRVEIRNFPEEDGGAPYLRRKLSLSTYKLWVRESGFKLEKQLDLPGNSSIHELRLE